MLLPDNIDREHIEAKHNHGVLTIEIKKEDQEAKKETKPIEVKQIMLLILNFTPEKTEKYGK